MFLIKKSIILFIAIIGFVALIFKRYYTEGSFNDLILKKYFNETFNTVSIEEFYSGIKTEEIKDKDVINELLDYFKKFELVKSTKNFSFENDKNYIVTFSNDDDEELKIIIDNEKSIRVFSNRLEKKEDYENKIVHNRIKTEIIQYNVLKGSIDIDYLNEVYDSFLR